MVESRLPYERRTKDPQTYAKTYASNADHMSTSDFMGADRPCIQCQHFGGWRGPTQSAVWCLDAKIVQANAEHGCAFWTQKEKAPPAEARGANIRQA